VGGESLLVPVVPFSILRKWVGNVEERLIPRLLWMARMARMPIMRVIQGPIERADRVGADKDGSGGMVLRGSGGHHGGGNTKKYVPYCYRFGTPDSKA
jgi:hypothetical protein